MKNLNYTVLIIFALTVSFYGQTRSPRRVKTKRLEIVQRLDESPKAAPKLLTLGVIFERYATTTDINADGTAAQTLEVIQRLTSEIGLEKNAKFERVFNGDLQQIEVLDARILKADGTKIPVPASAIQIKPTAQAEAAPAFSSLKLIEIKFPGIIVGDATLVKIRLLTTKPYFADHFDDIEVFPTVYEWKSIEVNFNAPEDFPLYTQAVDLAGGKIADENGRSRWRWTKENTPAAEIDAPMFDFYEACPKVAVTSFKNYEELGAAYWTEAAKKSTVTPEIQALADEITKNLKEPSAQAAAIYEWTNKNVRYLSVVLDRSGWIPHDAAQILANRYGDCKDYTTLLNALLKAKNIESYPVIIRSDLTEWFPEVAVPGFFNHAILYVPSLDLFADATAPNTRLGLIPQQIVGKKAFLAGAKNGVIKVPAGKPEDSQLLSKIDINFAADGSLKAVSKNTYQGRSEILFRPLFANSYLQKSSETFVKLLLGYYGIDGTGRILKIADSFKVGEPFEVEMEVEQNNFTAFNSSGSFRVPTGINIVNMLELEAYAKAEKRRTNLTMGATRIRENFTIRLPEGITVEKLPEAFDFKNTLGSFRFDFKSNDDGIIEALRELVISKDVISAIEYPQFRELINKMVEGFNSEIKYRANVAVGRQNRGKVVKNPPRPKSFEEMIGEQFEGKIGNKLLSARQIVQMETQLKIKPNDFEIRQQLVRYYDDFRVKPSPAKEAGRTANRLWFVRNRPEMSDYEVIGRFDWTKFNADQPEYKTLKTEWLKQIETNPNNARIRLNAAEFIRHSEPDAAEKMLLDGRKTNPDDYELPLSLNQIYRNRGDNFAKDEKPETIRDNRRKEFESGADALALLKKERSEERTEKRLALLITLTATAYRLDEFDRAERLATELILDFGQNGSAAGFETATHTGNIVLGLVALHKNDAAKAKDYLLIAIRAPLRDEHNSLSKVDTELAKKLFEKGEKSVVSEYLKLCESLANFKNYPDLYAVEKKALKLWQEQIKANKTPSFDFDKP